MLKIIIAVIIGLILFDISKKIIKLIFIKKQQKNLQKIINESKKIYPFDEEFWGKKNEK